MTTRTIIAYQIVVKRPMLVIYPRLMDYAFWRQRYLSRGVNKLKVQFFMRSKRAAGCLAVFGFMVLSSGCSSPQATQIDGAGQGSTDLQAVVVKRSDVTPVMSLNATVASSVSYEITSPTSGKISQHPNGMMSVVDDSGTSHPIKVPALTMNLVSIVPEGATVARGLPVATGTYSGFVIAAPVAGADLLRLQETPVSARAQISGGAEPFECQLLDPIASGSPDSKEDLRKLYCVVPNEQPAINALTGILAVRFPTTIDALVLPVEAVEGSVSSGLVHVRSGHSLEDRRVKLGATDGVQIVVTEGLKEGEVVEIPHTTALHG
ncbi:hypothetical protein [Paenarthrobacter sp. NPDC058040]|uniref:hypothetical protein n=1 Tax=unclassified Paenarthrobacter TaxID=2634190 RepID=UPI0036D75D60